MMGVVTVDMRTVPFYQNRPIQWLGWFNHNPNGLLTVQCITPWCEGQISRSKRSAPIFNTLLLTNGTERQVLPIRVRCEMETTSLLRNRYWVLRHGKSIPNERGLIVSSLVRLFHLFVFDVVS